MWLTIYIENLQNIEALVTNKNCPKEVIQQFKDSVVVFDSNIESLVISDYLFFKSILENGLVICLEKTNLLKSTLMKIGTKLLINKNKTLQDAKNLLIFIFLV